MDYGSYRNFRLTGDGAGSFAEDAAVQGWLPVAVNADCEDEENSDDGKDNASGHHFDGFVEFVF